MLGEHFDPAAAFLISEAGRPGLAVLDYETDTVVGMTRFINPDEHGVVEIGGTYIAPSVRDTGFNAIMKTLLLDHAFDSSYRKVEFADTRNTRSMAAVLKLGATQEGVLRKNRIMWTGLSGYGCLRSIKRRVARRGRTMNYPVASVFFQSQPRP